MYKQAENLQRQVSKICILNFRSKAINNEDNKIQKFHFYVEQQTIR